jgi:Nif-specific regulatory protein
MSAYVNHQPTEVHEEAALGQSSVMQTEVYSLVQRFSRSNCCVLLQGERGLGKGHIAEMIHARSPRVGKAFSAISLPELSETFIDTELFGLSDSVRAGLSRPSRGRLREADGGTVFFHEIGEFPMGIQTKLLRLLRDGSWETLGGGQRSSCDLRMIASSSQDLSQLVEAGRFHNELQEELSTFSIHIPPLRERKSDILHLADHFMHRHAAIHKKEVGRISSPAMSLILAHPWPGNLVELEHCIARAVLLSTQDSIEPHHLPDALRENDNEQLDSADTLQSTLHNVERALIIDALKASRGNCAKASVILGITERLMGLRVKKYEIDPKLYRHESA